jgi:hypothetical protein
MVRILDLIGIFLSLKFWIPLTVRGELDETTSHPTRLSINASQVVGYVEL